MKTIKFFAIMALAAVALTSCGKGTQTTETQVKDSVGEVVVVGEDSQTSETQVAEPVVEEVVEKESQSDEAYYDEILDKYEEALKTNDFEVISATVENLAEAEMEGLLTPAQVKRWHKLND